MIWYYAKEGAAAGPISDEDMLSRLRDGAMLPTTLIWRSGMAEWQAASSIFADIPAPVSGVMGLPQLVP